MYLLFYCLPLLFQCDKVSDITKLSMDAVPSSSPESPVTADAPLAPEMRSKTPKRSTLSLYQFQQNKKYHEEVLQRMRVFARTLNKPYSARERRLKLATLALHHNERTSKTELHKDDALTEELKPAKSEDQKEEKETGKSAEDRNDKSPTMMNKSTVSVAALDGSLTLVSTPPVKLTASHFDANKPSMAQEESGGQIGALIAKTHLADISDLNEKAEKVVNCQACTQCDKVSDITKLSMDVVPVGSRESPVTVDAPLAVEMRSKTPKWSSLSLYQFQQNKKYHEEVLQRMRVFARTLNKPYNARERQLKLATLALCRNERTGKTDLHKDDTVTEELKPAKSEDQKEEMESAGKSAVEIKDKSLTMMNKSTMSVAALHNFVTHFPTPPLKLTAPNSGTNKPRIAREEPGGQIGAQNAKTCRADISDLNQKAEKFVNSQACTQLGEEWSVMVRSPVNAWSNSTQNEVFLQHEDFGKAESKETAKPKETRKKKRKSKGLMKERKTAYWSNTKRTAGANKPSMAQKGPGGQIGALNAKTRRADISDLNKKVEKIVPRQVRTQFQQNKKTQESSLQRMRVYDTTLNKHYRARERQLKLATLTLRPNERTSKTDLHKDDTLTEELKPAKSEDQKEEKENAGKSAEEIKDKSLTMMNKSTMSVGALHNFVTHVPTPPLKLTAPNAGTNKPRIAREETGGQIGALNAKTRLADITDVNWKAEKFVNTQSRTQLGEPPSLGVMVRSPVNAWSNSTQNEVFLQHEDFGKAGSKEMVKSKEIRKKKRKSKGLMRERKTAYWSNAKRTAGANKPSMAQKGPGGQIGALNAKTRRADISDLNKKAEKVVTHQFQQNKKNQESSLQQMRVYATTPNKPYRARVRRLKSATLALRPNERTSKSELHKDDTLTEELKSAKSKNQKEEMESAGKSAEDRKDKSETMVKKSTVSVAALHRFVTRVPTPPPKLTTSHLCVKKPSMAREEPGGKIGAQIGGDCQPSSSYPVPAKQKNPEVDAVDESLCYDTESNLPCQRKKAETGYACFTS
ncbi:uncharacterized protein LOC132865963 isoform X2 [Neoarius graeffei]|uniref:uncharacterized protein LOC132865963 isoform X2 n=1 Tax=Neoarius graeffei TaxID=443677 RepID=UPI00298C29C2|nr:uncharacterized protein LOC132865963 isoform X2 [Neoarius graeffei]